MFELLLLATAIAEELADPCLGDAACYAELAAQGDTEAMAEGAMAEEAVAEEAPAQSEHARTEEARAKEAAADDPMAKAAANGKIPVLPQYKLHIDHFAPSNQLDTAIQALQQAAKQPRPPNSGDVLYAQLSRFRGKQSQYAFDRLGYPDGKMIVEGATVYHWINHANNVDGSPLRCTIKVVVRASKIVSTDFSGNEGACARYARTLDPRFRPNY